jgi:hypothetical protein
MDESDKQCYICNNLIIGRIVIHEYRVQNLPNDIKYACGPCQDKKDEDEGDDNLWRILGKARQESCHRRANAMINISKKKKIMDRVEFINDGTCLLDNRVYYYAQKKKARVKGQTKYYQMRGFAHFIKVFGKVE